LGLLLLAVLPFQWIPYRIEPGMTGRNDELEGPE
jgi:hypothetical protein